MRSILQSYLQGVAQFEENMAMQGLGGHKWPVPNLGHDDTLNFYLYSPIWSSLLIHQESDPTDSPAAIE